ncbi:Fc.00g018100.m01.CDS01 [Cosmosporella sp. VM-42]
MVSLRSFATAFASVALLIQSSLAHSVKRNPLDYVSLIEDINIKTPSHRVHAHSHFDVTFALHGGQQRVRLQLEPNHDILHESFAITHLGSDGKVSRVEQVDRRDNKVFKGHAYIRDGREGWSNAGWARITIHRDGKDPIFEGTFRINGDHHHVQTGAHYQQLRHDEDPMLDIEGDGEEVMVVWRDSDIISWKNDHSGLKKRGSSRSLCNSDSLGYNSKYHELRDAGSLSSLSPSSLFGRQSIDGDSGGTNGNGGNLISSIGSISGCPTTRKVALVGIATDCTYTASFNSSEALRKNIITQINAASQIYESAFNISLGIQNLTISNETCPGTAPSSAPWNVGCSDSVTLADRLNLFSEWRGKNEDSNGYWTLLSTCITESAVGLAWLGQICRAGSSRGTGSDGKNETIAAANVVVRTSTEWQVFAHETGHTFGAVHDCTADTCPVSSSEQSCCPLSANSCDASGKFIMNPSTSDGITSFSPCSIGNICSGFKANIKSDCLTDNKNIETITGSQCGNGIVESGEDCDCGGEQGCGDNSCCDAKTCKFKDNAVCDPTNEDCCTSKCQFASSGTVCRASTGDCDPEETCTGSGPNCPADAHKNDGESCGDGNGLKCASGQCTSRDLQCKNVVGNMTSASDTTACDSSGCLLSCKSPDFGYNTCANLNQNFLDGTSCGGGGKCSNGLCKGSSTLKEIRDWLNDHKTIVIPVGSVIGALILLAILSCFWSCIKRSRNRRNAPKPSEMSNWPTGAYARGGNPNIPPPLPPAYPYAPIDSRQQSWNRGRSLRYA